MKIFKYLAMLVGLAQCELRNRDIHGELYMASGFFGNNVKNDDMCSAFTECHQCVAGGCRYDAYKK